VNLVGIGWLDQIPVFSKQKQSGESVAVFESYQHQIVEDGRTVNIKLHFFLVIAFLVLSGLRSGWPAKKVIENVSCVGPIIALYSLQSMSHLMGFL